ARLLGCSLLVRWVNVVAGSFLFPLWGTDQPRRASQINLLGFLVFGIHVVLAGVFAVSLALLWEPPAAPAPVAANPANVGNPPEMWQPGGRRPEVNPRGLLAYWSFDEGQGNVAADGSGNGHLATLHAAGWTEGKRGKALEFDGTSAYCDLGNAPGLSFKQGEDVTVALWVKTDDAWGSILILRRKEDGGSAVCLAVEDGRLVGII